MTTPNPPAMPPGTPPPPVPGVPESGGGRGGWAARRIAAVAVGVAVLACAGLYAAAYAAAGSAVPRGTTVLGIDIGGLSTSDAEAKLAKELPSVVTRTVTVTAGDRTFSLDASTSGLAVDAKETVARIDGRSMNPGDLVPALFGATSEVAPVLAVDDDALDRAVGKMSKKVDQEVRDGRVRFVDGEAKARQAREGRELLTAETSAALRAAFTSGGSQVTAPVTLTEPEIGSAEVERVMREFAEPAMSAPVDVDLDGTTVELTPAELDEYLEVTAADGVLTPELDFESLAEDIVEDNDGLVVAPKDASFKFVNNKPKVVPGKDGEKLDPAVLGERLMAALIAPEPRSLVAEVLPAVPELTTEEAESLGITEKISSFRTEYPIAAYRITNIGRAAELMNESLVLPGDTWSLNDTVGERTEANGFVKGFVISEGKFAEDLGGGVSQSATTVFNAVFFAGLQDIEHHPHSLYISRYPEGREATVAFGSKDLRFRNDSGNGVLIRAEHEPGSIRVTFWGTKRYDKIESITGERHNFRSPDTIESKDPECMPQAPVTGFDVDVTRVYYNNDRVVRREKFETTYNATDRINCA